LGGELNDQIGKPAMCSGRAIHQAFNIPFMKRTDAWRQREVHEFAEYGSVRLKE
jgi:hypothetical protein